MNEPLIQIAFAGHNRPYDLGAHGPVTRDLESAFRMLGEAGRIRARLVSGLASGADKLAAAAWKRAGMGPAHAIYPFLNEGQDGAVGPSGLAQTATWLDGKASEKAGRNPHLEQTRWLIAAADLLVVVWTGEHARGAGGTADAVRLALDRGVPVLWISPRDRGRLRLIRAPLAEQSFDFAEFHDALHAGLSTHVEPATVEGLRSALALEEAEADEDDERAEPSAFDEWLHTWLWKTYAVFRKALGGTHNGGGSPPPDVPEDLAKQQGFKLLTEAYYAADRRANRLSAVHRSEQLLLLAGMVTAAVVGSLPALWPGLKLAAVFTELALGVAALMVWQSAAKARQHERWTETRRLAEQLRFERAAWATGVALVPPRASAAAREHGQSGRNVLREAGVPEGKFEQDRVARWGAWAMGELVGGQAAYHRSLSVRDGRISHRLHILEDSSFLFFLVVLTSFALGYTISNAMGHHLPKWMSGVVMMCSTIVPSLGAATMALEAKLEFREQSDRSRRIASRLDEMSARLGENPSSDEIQTAARAAMRLLVAEADQWREGAGRRRLFRP